MSICQMLVPGLYISDSTIVSINIDKKNKLEAKALSGRLALNANYLKDFRLKVEASEDSPSVFGGQSHSGKGCHEVDGL